MIAPLALLAGCGGAAKDNRIQITYQTIETLPEQQAVHRAIIAAFEREHTNIHVNVIYDTSKFQKLNVQLAGGAAPDVFDAYDRGIAAEYRGHVPGWLFRNRRRAFLKGLLARERIYLSDFFHERLDVQARSNLRRAITTKR